MSPDDKVEPAADVREHGALAVAESARRRRSRSARHAARRTLWSLTGLPRCRNCGRAAADSDRGVTLRVSGSGLDRRAGLAGVQSCGSVWACPVCSAKVAAERRSEIRAAVAGWTASGGRVGFLTLTMRHSKGQRLATLWDALSAAWSEVTSGSAWQADQLVVGTQCTRIVRSGRRKGQEVVAIRLPWVRVVEVTHGRNGWHVHVHALLFLSPLSTDGQAHAVAGAMFDRWTSALTGAGLRAPSRRRGLDFRVLAGDVDPLAEYFTKATFDAADAASLEVTGGAFKDARHGNRTPFAVLAGLVNRDTGEAARLEVADEDEDRAIWSEYERGSKGRRQMTWASGARALLLPHVVERTDEEIAAEDELRGQRLAEFTAEQWRSLAHAADQLLDLAESDDTGQALRVWLYERGVDYTPFPIRV